MSGASRAPAVVAADTDVVPGNHCWQYERRSAAVSITSTPDVPSGLVSHAESVIDQWIATFRGCEPVDPSQPVLVPGDPEWAAVDERERLGIPVKYSVLADLLEVAKASGVAPPFDAAAVDLSGVTRVVLEKT